jgi:hypothetical protein
MGTRFVVRKLTDAYATGNQAFLNSVEAGQGFLATKSRPTMSSASNISATVIGVAASAVLVASDRQHADSDYA